MRKSLHAAALVAALGIAPAGACGLHGTIDNPFTASYPGSFGVALSTQQAVANGQLAALPELDAEAANARLADRLDQLRTRLERAQLEGKFALFVVDSGHWARFAASASGVQIAVHAGPRIGEPILLTSESALAALLDGRLATVAAEQVGLVRWSGNVSPELARALQTALAADA